MRDKEGNSAARPALLAIKGRRRGARGGLAEEGSQGGEGRAQADEEFVEFLVGRGQRGADEDGVAARPVDAEAGRACRARIP